MEQLLNTLYKTGYKAHYKPRVRVFVTHGFTTLSLVSKQSDVEVIGVPFGATAETANSENLIEEEKIFHGTHDDAVLILKKKGLEDLLPCV